MQVVNVCKVRAHISALLDAVERGEDIIIERRGKPVARLTALVEHPASQGVRFPDRRALRQQLPACPEGVTATVRALRDADR
jgi:prevent-host-death family protein